MDRREFLSTTGAAAGAFVLGLPELARAEEAAWEEKAWQAALAAMKARKAHGVAIVLPEDARGRNRLASLLERRIPLPQPHAAEAPRLAPLLLECVWVLAAPGRAQAQPGETLVLLDPAGKRVAGAKVPFDDPAAFEKGVEALCLGEGRLEARGQAATTPEVTEALARMDQGQGPAAVEELRPRAEEVMSALVRAWYSDKSSAEVKTWVGSLLHGAYWQRIRQLTGLPFGIKWKLEETIPEPCPPCGMAAPSIDARKFLEFWGG